MSHPSFSAAATPNPPRDPSIPNHSSPPGFRRPLLHFLLPTSFYFSFYCLLLFASLSRSPDLSLLALAGRRASTRELEARRRSDSSPSSTTAAPDQLASPGSPSSPPPTSPASAASPSSAACAGLLPTEIRHRCSAHALPLRQVPLLPCRSSVKRRCLPC